MRRNTLACSLKPAGSNDDNEISGIGTPTRVFRPLLDGPVGVFSSPRSVLVSL